MAQQHGQAPPIFIESVNALYCMYCTHTEHTKQRKKEEGLRARVSWEQASNDEAVEYYLETHTHDDAGTVQQVCAATGKAISQRSSTSATLKEAIISTRAPSEAGSSCSSAGVSEQASEAR